MKKFLLLLVLGSLANPSSKAILLIIRHLKHASINQFLRLLVPPKIIGSMRQNISSRSFLNSSDSIDVVDLLICVYEHALVTQDLPVGTAVHRIVRYIILISSRARPIVNVA